jgi:hypothetical protein
MKREEKIWIAGYDTWETQARGRRGWRNADASNLQRRKHG